MAYQNQLSPELIAQLRASMANGGLPVIGPDGNYYYGVMDQGGSSGAGTDLQSIYAATPEMLGRNTANPGEVMATYDLSGKGTGTRPYEPDSQYSDLMGILSVLGVAAGGAMLGGAGVGGEAGTSALAANAGDAYMPGLLNVTGAEIPYGSVIPGLEGYVLPAGAAAAGGAAGASGGGAGGGGAAGGGAGGGGGLSGLLGGGANSMLGLGSTVLGGLLGGQGQKNEQNVSKDIPEWLKPSVFGLLQQTDALRNKQMAPGYMQGYDDMRSVGQGLLNQPIAGNGTGLFPSLYRK